MTFKPAVTPRGRADDARPNYPCGHRPLDRWDLLTLVTSLRRELGLTDRDVMVLRAHLTVLPQGPLLPSGVNVSFMSVTEILERACGMDARRFRRGEARLEQVGLVRRRLSANGRRFPERDRAGKIVHAYGIDLAPVFDMYPQLLQLQKEIEAERAAIRQRKNALSARLQDAVRRLISIRQALPEWAEALRLAVRNALRRTGATMADLDVLEAEIDQVITEADEHTVETAVADHLPPCPVPRDTMHEDAVLPDNLAADDGQIVRHIESEQKDLKKKPSAFEPRRIHYAWAQTASLKEFYPDTPQTERDLAGVLIQYSSFIGLGQTIILKALGILGWEHAIVVLDYLTGKATDIAKPEGYLSSMLRNYQAGQPIAAGRVSRPVPSKHSVAA